MVYRSATRQEIALKLVKNPDYTNNRWPDLYARRYPESWLLEASVRKSATDHYWTLSRLTVSWREFSSPEASDRFLSSETVADNLLIAATASGGTVLM
jgi:hypothetical protein